MIPNSPDFQEFLARLTNNALHSLKHADAIARASGSAYIGTEHLLLGVLAQEGSMGSKILEGAGITLDRARLALNLTPKTLVISMGGKGLSLGTRSRRGKNGRKSALEFFGNDMTELARQGKLDPVVGREAQIKRVITILNRRTKNNPVLIGEP